jgi:L-iditol 2-dehydrogenase
MSNSIPKVSRAAVLTGTRKFELKEFPVPNIGDDEMLLKVEGCGVCGTDAHEYKGDPFGLAPVILGHEGTGEIIKMGKNVKLDSTGTPVHLGDKLVTCIIPCGECAACRSTPQRTNLCDNAGIYGLMPDDDYHLNGYFADYVVIRKGSTFFKVNDMDLDQRLLVEPATVAIHAVERAKTTGLLNFSSKVLIQGCGPIGLLTLAVVRTLGVHEIIAIDSMPKRLDMAKALGATHVINFKDYKGIEELTQAVKDITEDLGADFVFQCTGVPAAAANAWKLVKRGGGLCEVGFFVNNGECMINPHFDLCNKEVSAVGSWVYTPQDYPTTFAFLKRAKEIGLPIDKLITHRFPLTEMTEALETNIRMDGFKVVFVSN